MADIAKLSKDYTDARAKFLKYHFYGSTYKGTLSNSVDFRDKYKRIFNEQFMWSSSNVKIEQHPYKGYPYKQGVKLVVNTVQANQPHYEPHVEVGGGADLFGVCVSIAEESGAAQVVPITDGMSFEALLVAKDNTIKRGDKLKFNDKGELEKQAGASPVHAYAIDDAFAIENDYYFVVALFIGNKVA